MGPYFLLQNTDYPVVLADAASAAPEKPQIYDFTLRRWVRSDIVELYCIAEHVRTVLGHGNDAMALDEFKDEQWQPYRKQIVSNVDKYQYKTLYAIDDVKKQILITTSTLDNALAWARKQFSEHAFNIARVKGTASDEYRKYTDSVAYHIRGIEARIVWYLRDTYAVMHLSADYLDALFPTVGVPISRAIFLLQQDDITALANNALARRVKLAELQYRRDVFNEEQHIEVINLLLSKSDFYAS